MTIPKKVLLVGKRNKEQFLLNEFLSGLGIETEIPHSLNEATDRINKSEDYILTLAQLPLTRTRSLDFLHSAPEEKLDDNFNWKVRLAIHRERSGMQDRVDR